MGPGEPGWDLGRAITEGRRLQTATVANSGQETLILEMLLSLDKARISMPIGH